jgi:uncharacterized protein (DUF1697 family)
VAAPTHAAFLRAVNLGATRKASSADLVKCIEGAGFDEVATFRTSGNVVFGGASGGAKGLRKQIEEALERALGFEVPVFVRTAAQVRSIAEQRPFPPKAVKSSKGKLQVALLENAPPAAAKKKVMALGSDDDRLALKGTELYWLPNGGTQKSALDLKIIERALGLNTLRTQGTIEQLAEKFFS